MCASEHRMSHPKGKARPRNGLLRQKYDIPLTACGRATVALGDEPCLFCHKLTKRRGFKNLIAFSNQVDAMLA